MSDVIFEQIQDHAKALKLDIDASEMAHLASEKSFTQEQLSALNDTLAYLDVKKRDTMVSTLLRLSRLPLKAPKTFDNYDFSRLHGKDIESLTNLKSLAPLYANENLAFIGPPGIGKTHLAMAFGRECCQHGFKTYCLTADELNQKLTSARHQGREGSAVNGLVKPSCLIIDEIGRCVFDKENTRLFFSIVNRRYNKEGPNTMIFTSNKSPDQWHEYFSEDDTLLCTLDRIYDCATVFLFKGESYRGRKLNKVGIEVGTSSSTR